MRRSLIHIRRFQVANTLGYLGVILVNAMANILPINGLNTGQVSDMFPNLFVPVPLTFGIWLVIYLGLGLFILYQWGVFSGWNDDYAGVTESIGWVFFISCLLNSLWIVAWHYLLVELSLIIMLLLFVSLLVIVNRLYHRRDPSQAEIRWAQGPFSIYFGWISVATIANVTAVLVAMEWAGFGIAEAMWTVIMIAIASLITVLVLVRRRNVLFSAVVLWTLLGIYLRHSGEFNGAYPLVIYTVMGSAALVVVVGLLVLSGAVGAKPRSSTLYLR